MVNDLNEFTCHLPLLVCARCAQHALAWVHACEAGRCMHASGTRGGRCHVNAYVSSDSDWHGVCVAVARGISSRTTRC